MDTLQTLAIVVLFIGLLAVSFDNYMHKRWVRERISRGWTEFGSAPASGMEVTGELTTGAKYAIWSYLFGILGIGGAVVSVVAGIAGYMINDLAKEKAIQVALNKMQEPLAKQLGDFASAQSALKTATEQVKTKDFMTAVASSLSNEGDFRKKMAAVLNDEAFRTQLADVLAAQHRDQLRGLVGPPGPSGPAGKDGKDGANGTSPSAASVAAVLNDEAFRTQLADVLSVQHRDQLRGLAGPPGPSGPAGKDGKDGANGTSPSASSVAAVLNDGAFRTQLADVLAAQHSDQLRGAQGAPGVSPAVEEVAAVLISKHGEQLRQIFAARFKSPPHTIRH